MTETNATFLCYPSFWDGNRGCFCLAGIFVENLPLCTLPNALYCVIIVYYYMYRKVDSLCLSQIFLNKTPVCTPTTEP